MSANSLQTVRKGRSLPFVFDRDGQDITGWICTISVQRYPGDTPAISRVIEPKDQTWPGFLTSTETAALTDIGTHMLIGNITNATENRAEFPIIRFSLAEAL